MARQEISFTMPVVVIQFAQDAGKELAEQAKVLAADAATLVAQKQAAFKDRMRHELVGPAQKMFECHRNTLTAKRAEVATFFEGQLTTIVNTITSMKANNVPDADNDFIAVKNQADELIKKRDEQLRHFDEALSRLDKSAKEAIDQFMA